MIIEMLDIDFTPGVDHPENRIVEDRPAGAEETEGVTIRSGLCKVILFSSLAGTVGSVFTFLCLGLALSGGDSRAAYSIWPLVLFLIAVINGWIAVNLFAGSGLSSK